MMVLIVIVARFITFIAQVIIPAIGAAAALVRDIYSMLTHIKELKVVLAEWNETQRIANQLASLYPGAKVFMVQGASSVQIEAWLDERNKPE